MNGTLYNFFTQDHRRIEPLLEEATRNPREINMDIYHQFRTGLLKHIKMEERILFPAAKEANNGRELPLQAKLKKDHGAITALLVVPPNPDVVKVIRFILEKHDILEEEKGGMYEACEALTKDETTVLLEQLKSAKEVPVQPHNDTAFAMKAAKNALNRAGYDFQEILKNE